MKNMIMKEILESIKEPRFMFSLVLLLVVVVASVSLLSFDYLDQKNSRELIERSRQDFVSKYANPNRFNSVMYCLKPISQNETVFSGAGDSGGERSFFRDHLKTLLKPVDLITIFSLLIPLVVIVGSYSSISAEKQKGTLKLIHSLGFSRARLILGKFAGNLAIIYVMFILVFLIAVLVLTSITGQMPLVEEWLSYGAIALALLLYTAFFLAVSLLVSASVRNSGTSILLLLCVWIVFVLLIPNISPVVASQLQPVPSLHLMENQYIHILNEERDGRIVKSRKRVAAQVRKKYALAANIEDFSGKTSYQLTEEKAADFANACQEYQKTASREEEVIRAEQKEKATRLKDEFYLKVKAQNSLARNLSLFSPTSSFRHFSLAFVHADEAADQHFNQEKERYQEQLWAYLEVKIKTLMQEAGGEPQWDAFMNLSDYPRFTPRGEKLEAVIARTIHYPGFLAAFALVTLLAAVIRYQVYDIR